MQYYFDCIIVKVFFGGVDNIIQQKKKCTCAFSNDYVSEWHYYKIIIIIMFQNDFGWLFILFLIFHLKDNILNDVWFKCAWAVPVPHIRNRNINNKFLQDALMYFVRCRTIKALTLTTSYKLLRHSQQFAGYMETSQLLDFLYKTGGP